MLLLRRRRLPSSFIRHYDNPPPISSFPQRLLSTNTNPPSSPDDTPPPPPTIHSLPRRRPKKEHDPEPLFQKLYPQLSAVTSSFDDTSNKFNFPLEGKCLKTTPPRVRFAPSPTGNLHVGGARTALYNYLLVQNAKSKIPPDVADDEKPAFILRIEDTDISRTNPTSLPSLQSDLTWLGLHPDEGPAGPYAPYSQSQRGDLYSALLNKLLAEGKAYPCFCTDYELDEMKTTALKEGRSSHYDNRWRDASDDDVFKKMRAGAPYTIRFKIPAGSIVTIDDAVRGKVRWDANATIGDFIIQRSDESVVYNFGVAVDDALMGITLVIRGEEHLTNTLRQVLILEGLGAPVPRYAHVSVITNLEGKKLSKRDDGVKSVGDYRREGFVPAALWNYLALLGWGDGSGRSLYAPQELVESFDVEGLNKAPCCFDEVKLRWVNGQHVRRMGREELSELVMEQIKSYLTTVEDHAAKQQRMAFCKALTMLAQPSMTTTTDAVTTLRRVLNYPLPRHFRDASPAVRKIVSKSNCGTVIAALLAIYDADPYAFYPRNDEEAMASFDSANDDESGSVLYRYERMVSQLGADLDLAGGDLLHPLRLALTGDLSGDEVPKELCLLRLSEGVVDGQKMMVMGMEKRIERLKDFLASVPQEVEEEIISGDDVTEDEEEREEATYDGPPLSALDIRVGRIDDIILHPSSEKLYIGTVSVGPQEQRQIAMGLRPYLSMDDLVNKSCLVVCNLKPRRMVGIKSHGMILCASREGVVRLVTPPVGNEVGERVVVQGESGAAYSENKVQKKKVLEMLLGEKGYLKTNEDGVVEFRGERLVTEKHGGVCVSDVKGGSVS